MTPQDLADAAKRLSEQVSLHIVAHTPAGDMLPDWNGPIPWMAARLSDGGSDGNLYPTKAAAAAHQLHPQQCAYLVIPPSGMTLVQAHTYLKFTRQMYENGLALADPDMQVSPPVRRESIPSVIQQIKRGK